MAILYGKLDLFESKHKLGFFNLKKDKFIKSFEFDQFSKNSFDILNNRVLIAGSIRTIIPIDIISHSKKKEFTLFNHKEINSVVCLNEKQFIVGQYDYISQFELDKDYKFKLLSTFELKCCHIFKFPKNRLLIKENAYEPTKIALFG